MEASRRPCNLHGTPSSADVEHDSRQGRGQVESFCFDINEDRTATAALVANIIEPTSAVAWSAVTSDAAATTSACIGIRSGGNSCCAVRAELTKITWIAWSQASR